MSGLIDAGLFFMKEKKFRKRVVLDVSLVIALGVSVGLTSCGGVAGAFTVPVECGEIQVEFGGK